ncbi:hypothetical protein [Enterococcus faecium]|nr:hypothetical protein [Enterococcus faecium]
MAILQPFGEPIERTEFIQHYMKLFVQVIKHTHQIDESDCRQSPFYG